MHTSIHFHQLIYGRCICAVTFSGVLRTVIYRQVAGKKHSQPRVQPMRFGFIIHTRSMLSACICVLSVDDVGVDNATSVLGTIPASTDWSEVGLLPT